GLRREADREVLGVSQSGGRPRGFRPEEPRRAEARLDRTLPGPTANDSSQTARSLRAAPLDPPMPARAHPVVALAPRAGTVRASLPPPCGRGRPRDREGSSPRYSSTPHFLFLRRVHAPATR